MLESLFTCVGVPATPTQERLRRRCFPMNIADILRATFTQNTSEQLILEAESKSTSQW